MIFNGIDLEPYFRIKDIRGRGLIKRRINSISVPGMPGEHITSINVPAKVLELDIRIISDSLRNTINELNAIFATDEPVPIVFPDEPEMTYWGTIETSEETGEKVHLNRHDTTIYIRRSDPYKYGPELSAEFPSDAVTLTNNGTAEAKPIFELEVLEPVTFAMIQNHKEEYQMIGRPVNVEDNPFVAEQLILDDTLASTIGWVSAEQVDNGSVSGEMLSDGGKFYVQSFGSESGLKWHGPSLKRSLPEPLQDFRIDISLDNLNSANGVGRVEVYLLDVNGRVVAKHSIVDAWEVLKRNRTHAYIQNASGSKRQNLITLGETTAESSGELWNDFHGILRLRRVGRVWTSYITKVTNGVHHARETRYFTDVGNEFQTPIAQVQLHMGTFGGHQTTEMYCRQVKVWKINNPNEHQIPYIAHPGDVITFDHKDDDILINGEDRTDLKSFGASYFKLDKGENRLVVMPSNAFNVRLKYIEPYR